MPTGRLESEHIDTTELFVEEEDSAEVEDEAAVRDRLIPDTPLPLHVLDVADVDVTLHLRNLVTGLFGAKDIELVIVMENDELHVDTGSVSLANGGTLEAELDLIRSGAEHADVQLSIIGEQFRFRPSIDSDGNPINRPRADLNVTLAASGGTVRELAASANGSFSLREGEGEIDNEFKGYVMRDLVSQLFASINPMAADSAYTQLHCGFVEFEVVDGVAKSRAVGLQTDKLAMASVGTLNLATEALDLSFRVKQREGVGVSLAGIINPYIRLGGTLASPALKIDKKRGLLSGTVAVFTGGLSILAQGVWDRYLSRADYCQAVIEALDAGEILPWEDEPDGP